MWTADKVKEELPKVNVKIGKKIVKASISGRKLKFAQVWTRDNLDGWEFSWQTIANCLNNDRPLTI